MLPVYFSEKKNELFVNCSVWIYKVYKYSNISWHIFCLNQNSIGTLIWNAISSVIAILIKEDLTFYSLETLGFKTVDLNSFISCKSIFPSHNLHFFSNGVCHLNSNNKTLPPQEANYYPFSIDIIVLNQKFNINKFIPNPTEYHSNRSCQ